MKKTLLIAAMLYFVSLNCYSYVGGDMSNWQDRNNSYSQGFNEGYDYDQEGAGLPGETSRDAYTRGILEGRQTQLDEKSKAEQRHMRSVESGRALGSALKRLVKRMEN